MKKFPVRHGQLAQRSWRSKMFVVMSRLRLVYLLGIVAAILWVMIQIPSSIVRSQEIAVEEEGAIRLAGEENDRGDGLLLRRGRFSDDNVVVIYTGPTSLNATDGKHWLYLKNFEYFLTHGIECLHQDTVLVLTEAVAAHYENRISDIKQRCDSQRRAESSMTYRTFKNPSVRVIYRQDRCYDMEGFRMALEHVDFSYYDFMVYLNCGVVGPKLPDIGGENRVSNQIPWTRRYTSLLSKTVKLAGLSINAYNSGNHCCLFPHVQSMLFALDNEGLRIVRETDVVFDCGESTMTDDLQKTIIARYELGLSRAILKAGYNIRSTHSLNNGPVEISRQDIDKKRSLEWCKDMWDPERFPLTADSKWEDFMFFKSSRLFLLPGMEEEIQYNHDHEFVTLKLHDAGVTKRGVD